MYLLNEVLLCDITESNEGGRADVLRMHSMIKGQKVVRPCLRQLTNLASLHHNHESGP